MSVQPAGTVETVSSGESAPRAASKRSVATVDVAQRFAIQVETVDEHAVGAQVCGKREADGRIGKDAVGVRRFLTLGIRSFSRVLHHLGGWAECTIRLD